MIVVALRVVPGEDDRALVSVRARRDFVDRLANHGLADLRIRTVNESPLPASQKPRPFLVRQKHVTNPDSGVFAQAANT